MRNLLFISHRFPYPPDRGEKIRAWHLIKHLAQSYRIFCGCLVDDDRDWQYRRDLDAICCKTGCFPINRKWQKIRAISRMRPNRPLMLDYYSQPDLHRWIKTVVDEYPIEAVYVYTTAMAPYADNLVAPLKILDMVDVDSEKWVELAAKSSWPARLVWSREGRTLLAYERRAALAYDRTLLVSEAECDRFSVLAPETRERVHWLENGVDLNFFTAQGADLASPYPIAEQENESWLILLGNMDYWPNVDAAVWFAHEVLPLLQCQIPSVRFAIVGARPTPQVTRLAALPGVLVTGRVADVRPYLVHAAAMVAPLRTARGIQNKVLEGMAMGCAVVASSLAFEGIRAVPGRDLLIADSAESMVGRVVEILAGHHPGLGDAARQVVEQSYSWAAKLAPLDTMLDLARSPE
jgi:sugar transferase (PEP-CTERM/EpsH1 system associated)